MSTILYCFRRELTGEPWVRWPPAGRAHAQDGCRRFGRGLVNRRSGCLCAGMGLYIDKAASKELCRWMACPHIYAGGRRDTAFQG